MRTFIVPATKVVSLSEFVAVWSPLYSYGDEVYEKHIHHGHPLRRADLQALMQWKSGPRHAKRALAVADKVDIGRLNSYRLQNESSDNDLRVFYAKVAKPTTRTGIIWPLMLCHIARPSDVPIYDVNTWHAWGFIDGWLRRSHLNQQPVSFETYVTDYRPFFTELLKNLGRPDNRAARDLDRALFRFGQFLKSQLGAQLVKD